MNLDDNKVFVARGVLYEMVKDRNYLLDENAQQQFTMTFDEFQASDEADKYFIAGIIDTRNDLPVLIHFTAKDLTKKEYSPVTETKTNYDKSVYSDMLNMARHKYPNVDLSSKIETTENVDALARKIHSIVIYNMVKADGKLYSFIEDNPKLKRRDNFEFFGLPKLQFNVTKHVLQPKFRLLNQAEKKEVYDNFNATVATLQKFCKNDVVVCYFDARVGDVFEISGDGYAPKYRVVHNRLLPKRS